MPGDGAGDLAREGPGVVRIVQRHIVDRNSFCAKRSREMAHRRQHQHDLLLVPPRLHRFLHHLHHQDDVGRGIESAQRRDVQAQLVAQNDTHGARRRGHCLVQGLPIAVAGA
jgi:hypothetical protein